MYYQRWTPLHTKHTIKRRTMDAEYIREVIGRIDKLDSKEKTHILSILKGTNNTFTKNANGYFFNLAAVPEEIITKIEKCVELIEKNRDLIKDMDRRRESLLIYYKGVIEETLLSSMRNKREKYLSMLRVLPLKHNMTLVINRKQTIKWRYKYGKDCNVDPDELIKEYNKSRYVYEKNSVYGRILARMKAMRTGKNKGSGCEAGGDSDTFGSGGELPDYEDGEADAEYYEGGDDGEAEIGYSENDKQSDYEKDSENPEDSEEKSDELDPEHPDEYDKSAQEDDNEDGNQTSFEEEDAKSNKRPSKTTKTTKSSKTTNPSKTKTDTEHTNTNTHEQEMTFYKRLLNQQGFKFREKVVALTYQEYIK